MIKEKRVKHFLNKGDINMAVQCPICKQCVLKARVDMDKVKDTDMIYVYCPDCGTISSKPFSEVF